MFRMFESKSEAKQVLEDKITITNNFIERYEALSKLLEDVGIKIKLPGICHAELIGLLEQKKEIQAQLLTYWEEWDQQLGFSQASYPEEIITYYAYGFSHLNENYEGDEFDIDNVRALLVEWQIEYQQHTADGGVSEVLRSKQ